MPPIYIPRWCSGQSVRRPIDFVSLAWVELANTKWEWKKRKEFRYEWKWRNKIYQHQRLFIRAYQWFCICSVSVGVVYCHLACKPESKNVMTNRLEKSIQHFLFFFLCFRNVVCFVSILVSCTEEKTSTWWLAFNECKTLFLVYSSV